MSWLRHMIADFYALLSKDNSLGGIPVFQVSLPPPSL
uniref:Uncharacterized protein n=1 Tax=Arundo donax TaxID=35708 RepID=A0A0A8Y6H6_ARUDO